VGAIKREPTPPGPITDLFDRLHEIHLEAGQPSIREIATRVGPGVVSSSTIHNMFRGPRVPKWGFLELVVEELRGDTAEFSALWQAARRAEEAAGKGNNPAGTSLPGNSKPAVALLDREVPARSTAPADRVEPSAPGPTQRIWSTEIPRRNPHFAGRVAELQALRANLAGGDRPHPPAQLISGMGGIGKTEIATEYIHQYRDKYQVIWWIRAEQTDRVRAALVRLGQRLEVRPAGTEGGRDRTIAAVLGALSSGVRPNWLLVYDNAAQPLELKEYLPTSLPGGHIIITSRQHSWPGYVESDGVEVSPFTPDEAVSFLRRRVPVLGANRRLPVDEDERRISEAARLAHALGHLPIAVEHAAAYLTETGQTVDDYLTRFEENARRLPSEQHPDFPASAPATWATSATLLTPDARHLLNLCAFFSPEPIAAELFLDHAGAVSEPPGLGEFLSSPSRFRAAASQMHRLSLVKVDGARDQIQMHRVVQAVTRSQLRQNLRDMFQAYRTAVDILLAESNPGHPDQAGNDATYDLSLQHLESERNFFNTSDPALRRLIIDQVRRLHLRGRHVEAMRFGQDALRVWRERLGRDHLQVLTMAVEVTIALRILGYAAEARELSRETLRLLKQAYGDDHEITLLCINTHGADLRSRAQFGEALDLDLDLLPKFERIYGTDHERTLNVRNNLAADYRRLGRLREALETDRRTFEDRRRILGARDPRTLTSHDAVALDLRSLGLYQESLDIARQVARTFAAAGGGENPDRLNARMGFAAALRKAGHYWDALQESEDVFQRYREYLGAEHTYTLRAGINLINDRRAVDDLAHAEELGREICDRCRQIGYHFEFGYAALVSLASVLRVTGQVEEARRHDLQAREGLVETYGDLHPFTLAAGINYAADLAACGDLAAAIRIGQDTLANSRAALGPDHPDTLKAAVNLAIDLAAAGSQARADRLLGDARHRYAETLTTEHPEARAAAQGARLTAEIEAY
jgi:tetratricopeptide (TPR) repeat protein